MTNPVRSRREILGQLLQWWRARSSSITYFGQGVLTGLGESLARNLQHLENERYIGMRSQYVDTAEGLTAGDPLVLLGSERGGLAPLGASQSSVVVVFAGTAGSVVPPSQQIRAANGVVFETTNTVNFLLGTNNPVLLGMSLSEGLGDAILARSTTTGSTTNVGPETVTTLIGAQPGVASVTNPLRADGGTDAETVAEFRARIKAAPEATAQGTEAFFLALLQAHAIGVAAMQVFAEVTAGGVRLHLLHRSGAGFSAGELTTLTSYIAPRTKAGMGMVLANVVLVGIQVSATVNLAAGYTLQEAMVSAADALAEYLDWRTWAGGTAVDQGTLLATVLGVPEIETLDETSFSPAADVAIPLNRLPRLTSVILTDAATGSTAGGPLIQSYTQ